MYVNLQQLIIWPDAELLRERLPAVFKPYFQNARCIIDCFEVFIERPLSFQARAATYSNYKKHNTVNVFIAVAPTGAISFISKAWGGGGGGGGGGVECLIKSSHRNVVFLI